MISSVTIKIVITISVTFSIESITDL